MLLRLLFIFLLSISVQSLSFAVGTTLPNPTTVETPIFNQKKKKGNFFQRIQRNVISKKVEKWLNKIMSQECDIVILRNGDEVDVSVVQITDEEVLYRPCGTEGKATDSYRNSEVFMIKYANGEKFVFKDKTLTQVVHAEPNTKGGFVIGFFMGLLLGAIGILVIVLGFEGKRKRNALRGAVTAMMLSAIILFTLLFGR